MGKPHDPSTDEWKRERRRNGDAVPVPQEVIERWARESGLPLNRVPLTYKTVEWNGAGRPPGDGSCTWYRPNASDWDLPWAWEAYLEDLFKRNHYRRQVEAPDADGWVRSTSVPHYIVQRGMPRAFTYAVGLGTGIKVGKSGTGDGDLVTQLSGRFGAYKSTHPVEVIGLCSHHLEEIEDIEGKLLARLAAFKLDFGEEIFQDCPEVRNVIWKWFGGAWHQPKLLETLEERWDYWRDISRESLFHNLKGKSHVHAFEWRDYVRLVEEIDLCHMVLTEDMEGSEEIVQQYRHDNCLPAFGESEDDDLLLEMLSLYLPKEESIYPKARRRLHDFMGWAR